MSREKALVKNTFIISLGTFLPKLTSLITLPILTACLTKSEYGTYDLIDTLIALLLPMATLKIEAAAFRFLIDCRDKKEETIKIISTILFFVIPVSLIAVILMVLIAFSGLSLYTKLLIGVYSFISISFSAIQQIIRGISLNLLYSISAIVNAVVNMIMVVLLVRNSDNGLNGLMLSLVTAQVVSVVVLVVLSKLGQYIKFKAVSIDLLKEMISYSWPMIPNSLSLWAMNLSDRVVVTAILGIEKMAVYVIANKIPSLFGIIQSTFVFAWQENASMAVGDSDSKEYYSQMFDTIFSLLTGAMAGLIGFTPILFKFFIRGDYNEAYYQMPILFGGIYFSAISSFLGGIYVAHKKTKSVGITTIIAAIINLGVNIMFIHFIGLYAASVSTLVSYVFLVCYRMKDIQIFQPMRYNIKKIIRCISVLIMIAVICFINNFYFNILNLMASVVFALVLNRKMLNSILENVIKTIKKVK